MPATKIESIYVRFLGNAASYMVAAAAVQKSLVGIGGQAKVATAAMHSLKAMLVGGLVSAASIVQFAKMDKAMTQSLAIMGDLSDAMRNDLKQSAVDLSLETSTSMEKLADGYFFLASAGFTAKQSLEALDEVNRFAIAGNFDMARATDLLTDAQSALGLTSADAVENMESLRRVSDVLVKANTLANASTLQFSTALTRQAATSMRTFKIEVEEGVAVLAAYADQGIKAELAGTSYDRVLRLLSRSALKNGEAHRKYGLEVFDADGKMNSMVLITKQLQVAFKDLSTEERVAALEALGFQARVQQAIFPLIGMSDKIAEYERGLRDAGGITEEVANKQLQAFISQLKIAWNHVKLVGEEIGEIMAPKMLFMTDLVKKATLVWKGWSDTTKKVIVNTTATVLAIAPLIAIFTTLPMWVAGATLAMKSFAASLLLVKAGFVSLVSHVVALIAIPAAALSAPWLLVATAIAGIVASGVAFVAFISGVWNFGEAWKLVKAGVGDTFREMRGFFKNWESNWPKVKSAIYEFATTFFTQFKTLFSNLGHNIYAFAMATSKVLGILFGWFQEQGVPMAVNFGIKFLTTMAKVFDNFIKFAQLVTLQVLHIFVSMSLAISRVFEGIMISVMKTMMKMVSHTAKIIAALKSMDFKEAIQLAAFATVDITSDLITGAKAAGAAAMEALEGAFKPLVFNFLEGLGIGANTNDLAQSLRDAWANAGFVHPLAGTAFDPANFTLVDRDVTEFMGPMQMADMLPGFVGPMPLPAFRGPPEGPDGGKKEKDFEWWRSISEGIEATTRRSNRGIIAAHNSRMRDLAGRKRRKAEEQAEQKKENLERAAEREEEERKVQARATEMFNYMKIITDWIGDQAGAVFANFGGS